MKKITILLTFIFIICSASFSFASSLRMAGSDLPTWSLSIGMSKLNKLKDISYTFEKYGTCIDGFAQNKYDITFMTLFEFIGIQRDDPNGVIIAATDYSNGADNVIVRPEISSASDLRGKKLGLDSVTLSLQVLDLYLKKNEMTLNDIKISNVAGEFVSKAFKANKSLSGIVGWHPNLDGALDAGGKIMFSSADIPEKVFDVIVVNKKALESNRPVVVNLLKTWFAELQSTDVIKKSGEFFKVSGDEFKAWLGDFQLYTDAKSNLASFPKMKEVAKEIQEMYNTKPSSIKGKAAALFGDKPLDIEAMFDDSILKEIQ